MENNIPLEKNESEISNIENAEKPQKIKIKKEKPKKIKYDTEKYIDEVEAKYQGKKDKDEELKQLKADKLAKRQEEMAKKAEEKKAKSEEKKLARQQAQQEKLAKKQEKIDAKNRKKAEEKAKIIAIEREKKAEENKKEMSKLKSQLSTISQLSKINNQKKVEEKAEEQISWLSVTNKQDISISSKPKEAKTNKPVLDDKILNTIKSDNQPKNKLTLEKLEMIKNKMSNTKKNSDDKK